MLFRASTLIAFALFAAPGSTVAAQARPAAVERLDPRAWVIGPVIRGRNYSRGMPLHPSPRRGGGWQFEFPQAPASVHQLTFAHGSLSGKRRIVMRYRVEAAPGVKIYPRTAPGGPSIITMFFQRRGDNWSARGPYEAYRWYATFASQSPITPGNHVMSVPLNGNWSAVMTSNARANPRAFADAIANADQVGFVLGGGDGFGHGVFATGPARLVVTSFRVE